MGAGTAMIAARAGAAALVLGSVAAAAAPPVSAEQALAAERASLHQVIAPRCDRGGSDIVVCGRNRQNKERVPFPDQTADGSRTHLVPGEPPSAVAAMHQGDDPCSNVGPQPRCGGMISFITVGLLVLKYARHLADPDSDPPPTPIGAEAHPPE